MKAYKKKTYRGIRQEGISQRFKGAVVCVNNKFTRRISTQQLRPKRYKEHYFNSVQFTCVQR